METLKTHIVHGGTLRYLRHDSATTGTPMTLSVFVPPGEGPFPVLIWLSGLTCTEDNFTTKAGAYGAAAEHGVIIVAPDTSPRGEGVADDAAYDLGQGAGFYIDATQAPWAEHFRMESYVTGELIGLIDEAFPTTKARAISERVESVTAFTGQSLEGPAGATVLLHMTDGARESPDLPTLQALADRLGDAGVAEGAIAELSKPALPAQGLAFEHGRGRVVVLGEAGMLSAQLVRYPPESGQPDRRFGMNAAPGNARFGLNILHWLTGLLP